MKTDSWLSDFLKNSGCSSSCTAIEIKSSFVSSRQERRRKAKKDNMKKEYNFSKAKVHKGPIVSAGKKLQKTIRLDENVLDWLMKEGEKRGIPYQTLLNSILKNAMNNRSLDLEERLSRIEEKLNLRKTG